MDVLAKIVATSDKHKERHTAIMIEKISKNIPFILSESQLAKTLHCNEDSYAFQRCTTLYGKYFDHFNPAFIVREFCLNESTEDGVYIQGHFFKSRILAKLLRGNDCVIIYIATCGNKIGELLDKITDSLDHYLLDQLAYLAYQTALNSMHEFIQNTFNINCYKTVCPGSLIDWSVLDIKIFFILMSGSYEDLGLRVLDSGLIWPLKSTSGLIYETNDDFSSCMLCNKEKCENRTSPFNSEKYMRLVLN